MSREEYLRQLQYELRSLSPEERENAMRYYREYLSDAEDVEAAMASLGSPKKVAADILRECGAVSARRSAKPSGSGMDRNQKLLLCVLLVLAAVCILPACAAGIGGLVGILVGILCVVLAAFLVFLALSVGFTVAAILCLTAAILRCAASAVTALLLFGLTLLFLGLAILSLMAFLWMCRTLIPAAVRSVAALGRRLFHPKGGVA